MKFNLVKKLPRKLYVAVSGGADSMVALDYLSRCHDVTVLHYVHKHSQFANTECTFVDEYCRGNNLRCIIEEQRFDMLPGQSKEAFWREGRYNWFRSFSDHPVVVAHTLNDAVETYLFSAFHGKGIFMEYSHANCIRPFLLTRRNAIEDWATLHQVPFLNDPSNSSVEFASRNRIRHNILPEVLKVNPGIYKIVSKRILEKVNGTPAA